ncbi:MAG: hypothetical protein M9924_12290 [Rhizobiaceae bacterium]|nr:hypothetical protein [Rhizobiaceae bacterium]
MDSYSFWQDFFSTFRASSDFIKALWILVPPAFVVAQTWVVMRTRPPFPQKPTKKPDQLIRLSLLEVPVRANLQRGTLTER